MNKETIDIKSKDYWFKVVGMLQQNWALIDNGQNESCTVFFVHDGSGVFDMMEFKSLKKAQEELLYNGFRRYGEDSEAQKIIGIPKPPFHNEKQTNEPIYSSSQYWRRLPSKATKQPNLFINIIRSARYKKWCLKLYCTTCGARDYRDALNKLAGPLGGGLAKALAEINPRDLTAIKNWEDALLIAIGDLPIPLQLNDVLQAWLPKINDDLPFADFVLYNIVSNWPTNHEIKNEWIKNCISLAIDANNFSLIESIILVLRKDALNYPNLIAIAKEHAKTSAQMRKVLKNV
jgi:hypothetical protein